MLAGSKRFSTPRSFSAFSTPRSVRVTVRAFSSTSKSPSGTNSSPLFKSGGRGEERLRAGMMVSTRRYCWVDCSDGPEMISGVRASSMRMESTSSTMAKFSSRWTRDSL